MSGDSSISKKAFVCGWPIEQSKSPIIHSHWLSTYGLAGSYEKIAVAPENLRDFVKGLDGSGFAGGNFTIPHKESMLDLVDQVDDAAKKIGAINTIWRDDGKWVGGNTDWIGFAANLDDATPDWRESASSKKAMVIGAGGAARGILYALLESGFKSILLANRTMAKAEQLAIEFGEKIQPIKLDDVPAHLAGVDLLINTSSMGMQDAPAFPDIILAALGKLPASAIVTDIVYVPLVTPLLSAAQNRGLKTVDGLGMLLHQAVPGFEKWFGVKPEVTDALRSKVLKAMGLEEPLHHREGTNGMIILGLTGSIGMGKSTTAQMFREAGIPVHDADASVHALYAGKAAPLIEAAFPGTVVEGVVDRGRLGQHVIGNKRAMKELEAIIHPLVAEARDDFLAKARGDSEKIVVLDIPLLFETDGQKHCDKVVVVTAPAEEQRRRVLAREGMDADKFEKILASQIPDAQKRKRADFTIDTSKGLEAARDQVSEIIEILKAETTPNA